MSHVQKLESRAVELLLERLEAAFGTTGSQTVTSRAGVTCCNPSADTDGRARIAALRVIHTQGELLLS